MARKIFAQDPVKYIPALAAALNEMPEFAAPEWSFYVKSGTSRQRAPIAHDFWQTRAASILRQLYIHGVLGVGKLRTRYGGRKDRGGKPDHFKKASGKIIRVILQQAEEAGIVEKLSKLQHGRRLTQKGRDLLDSIEVEAAEMFDYTNAMVEVKPVEQEEMEDDSEETEKTEEIEQEIGEDKDGK
ncbi:MAG: small subunit ribosomal protein S19e [Patescibacteria group bacterium]|jgi:small subunit ribosomal protein S19e